MLKLTYTERSFNLECLALSLEEWVAQRVVLAMRVGQSFYVEPSSASFLLPVDLPGVEMLEAAVKRNDTEIIDLSRCDAEYLEVTLKGSWLSEDSQESVGVFVTTMSDRTEFFLNKIWQEAQACASAIRE